MTSGYRIMAVNDPKTAIEFLNLPIRLYKEDPNWIRPIDDDITKVFSPSFNKFFRHGELIRWILVDAEGVTIGRVAAFFDRLMAKKNEQPTGGMGFFECINNPDAAKMLFDACCAWLRDNGMEAMDGPVNFGERDRWWGLLVDGFFPPNYGTNYNFPYYKSLFENYGFRNYFEQYTYHRMISLDGLDPVIGEKAERIFKNPRYSFVHLVKKDMYKFAEDFRIIYNKAWVNHSGVKPVSKAQARILIRSMKPILDEKLMWFAYYDNEPVGCFLMLPELNQIFKHVNGKLGLIGKIKVAWYKYTHSVTKAFGFMFGIVPEHQGKGLEGAISMAFGGIALRPGFPYRELELNWIGDFNPTMMHLVEEIGARIIKTHITYRYLFDRDKPFVRARKIGGERKL